MLLRMRRIGTNYVVKYTKGATEAKVRENQTDFIGMPTSIHFAFGLWLDDRPINVWGMILFLTSVGLFLIGATGVYLWFQTYEGRLIGSILLGVGLTFSIGLIVIIRVQG